ncbi:TetR/AcrR family transcriptional regulator [Amycolatopsis sp. H6(2020)]|nr:TetR/AcrR family transcriptional regulator [Amycolatopsis sp. H6(2020)]
MSQLAFVEGLHAPPRVPAMTSVPSGADSPGETEAAHILRAAWAVLERSHFRSLKIRQVLTASNTSASTFYRSFPSKAHLVVALLADETARGDRRLARWIAEADSAEGRLRAWLKFNIRTIYRRELAERARLFIDSGLLEELPEEVHRLYDVSGRRLVEVIRGGMAERVFRAGDPVADAAMVRHLMRGLLTDGLNGQLDMSEEQALHTALDFVLRALRPAFGTREDLRALS